LAFTALVIGYGSIGSRHADILASMSQVDEVYVLSSQEYTPYKTIRSMKEIRDIDPDYIVVASNTSRHFEELYYLENNFRDKTILVEKPLFRQYHDLNIQNNSVWVGYNLRFHPLIQLIKRKTYGKNLWHIQVFCGSYLPEWRPGRDYRDTSSAKRDKAGGVLLDLSHELDYVQWMAGKVAPEYVVLDKVSDLDIETDDLLVLVGRTEEEVTIQITLNYFTRQPVRQIIVDGEGISIEGDLIVGSAKVMEEGNKLDYAWPELSQNSTYQSEHEALLSGDIDGACTYLEGQELMRLIDLCRSK
jgi:CMP-N,N'-diacetyllegionaminic acid synthase|tara:strand:+ start:558 stop:1463 length:906 start_codon:yes stop_codon:yes gene_type:complete